MPVFGVLTIRRVANDLVTCLLCFGIALAVAPSWWGPCSCIATTEKAASCDFCGSGWKTCTVGSSSGSLLTAENRDHGNAKNRAGCWLREVHAGEEGAGA